MSKRANELFAHAPPVREITVAAIDIAKCLLWLPSQAAAGNAASCREGVASLQKILAATFEQFQRSASEFACENWKTHQIGVRGFVHPTAHHAVFEQAAFFLSALWERLDQWGYWNALTCCTNLPAQPPVSRNWLSDSAADGQHRWEQGLDFEPQLVVEHAAVANATILDLLSEDWRNQFQGAVNQLARECDLADAKEGRSLGGCTQRVPESLELPVVDLKLSQVRFAGSSFDITSEAAQLVQALNDVHPEYFSASAQFTKPSRIKKTLPTSIQAIIETRSGKGYRWKL